MNNSNDFDKTATSLLTGVFKHFGKFWLAALVLNLGILAFLGWAIYRLVMHFTG